MGRRPLICNQSCLSSILSSSTIHGLAIALEQSNTLLQKFYKRECKEPSKSPFKRFLTGSSPVAFANLNVNAKRSEQHDSQSWPNEFESHHVRQFMPL